jgi:hypothetical protein
LWYNRANMGEQLRRQPDQNITEPQLSPAEVGKRAGQFIEQFKQAIGDVPETPFRLIRRNKAIDLIYKTSPEGEKLIMQQHNPGSRPVPVNNPYLGQYISLGTEVNQQSHEIDGGEIMHSNVHLYIPDRAPDTRTAIQRIEDFYNENFVEPQDQATTGK